MGITYALLSRSLFCIPVFSSAPVPIVMLASKDDFRTVLCSLSSRICSLNQKRRARLIPLLSYEYSFYYKITKFLDTWEFTATQKQLS